MAPLLAEEGLARDAEGAESLVSIIVTVCVPVTNLLLQDAALDVASVHLCAVVNNETGLCHILSHLSLTSGHSNIWGGHRVTPPADQRLDTVKHLKHIGTRVQSNPDTESCEGQGLCNFWEISLYQDPQRDESLVLSSSTDMFWGFLEQTSKEKCHQTLFWKPVRNVKWITATAIVNRIEQMKLFLTQF